MRIFFVRTTADLLSAFFEHTRNGLEKFPKHAASTRNVLSPKF